LQSAASAGDTGAILWGLGAMIAVIILIDQLVWRPAIAWSEKFKFEQVEATAAPESWVLNLLRKSPLLTRVQQKTMAPLDEYMCTNAGRRMAEGGAVTGGFAGKTVLAVLIAAALAAAAGLGVMEAFHTLTGINWSEVMITVESAGATFLRVLVSLAIASLWTIPAGVAIGLSPRLARIAQPLAQIAASVPATALFPVVLLALIKLGGGLNAGSILLMLLGTQWYILFNVIAGATAIPSEFLEVAEIFRFSRLDRWRKVILPGIFPYLITGLVTASGGAWNASIIAEYFHFQGKVLSTFGLGAEISSATDDGNFAVLLLSTIVMATLVVTVNRMLWRPLYHLAETRYKLES
jgi:NitT/TauT family transport system permease protein